MTELSSPYRASRRNTSLICGVGLAWSAAQFDIASTSISFLENINLEGASLQVIFSILCIYSMTRCTIEYMMQNKDVRRWDLANLDYIITLYMARLTIFVLAASFVSRSSMMVLFLTGSFLGLLLGYFIISVLLFFVILIFRYIYLSLRKKMPKGSPIPIVLSSEAWGFAITGLAYIVFFVLSGFSVINPLSFAGPEFSQIGKFQMAFFAVTCLVIVLSFFFDMRFLRMVFAYVPIMFEDSYTDAEGTTYYESGLNPEHPDYEKRMEEQKANQTRIKKWKDRIEGYQREKEGRTENDKVTD